MARAMTSAPTASETADWTRMVSFAHRGQRHHVGGAERGRVGE
jgi:hypothetical protein